MCWAYQHLDLAMGSSKLTHSYVPFITSDATSVFSPYDKLPSVWIVPRCLDLSIPLEVTSEQRYVRYVVKTVVKTNGISCGTHILEKQDSSLYKSQLDRVGDSCALCNTLGSASSK